MRELHSRNGMSAKQRGCYRSALCGALMTGSRAAKEGHLAESRCPLCGELGDTISQGLWMQND